MEEASVKGKGDEGGRANSESFTDSSGGVSSSGQSVSSGTHIGAEVSHFSNTTSIIRDGAIAVNGEGEGQVGEHTKSSNSDTVVSEEEVAEVGSDGDEDGGDDSGEVAQGETKGDVGGGASLAGVGEVTDWVIGVRDDVLSEGSNDETRDETED